MCRADLERMKEVLGAAAEKDKSLPIPNKKHGGRTKAKEVEGDEKDGVVVPKKPVKEKTQYAEKQEKKKEKREKKEQLKKEQLKKLLQNNSTFEVNFKKRCTFATLFLFSTFALCDYSNLLKDYSALKKKLYYPKYLWKNS